MLGTGQGTLLGVATADELEVDTHIITIGIMQRRRRDWTPGT